MAEDLNVVSMTGRLTKDAESRKAGETPVAICRFASTTRAKEGGDWVDKPNYFDLVIWGREGLHQYLTKGKQLAVTGQLRWREWEKDGQKNQRVEIHVNQGGHIGLLGGGEERKQESSNDDPFGDI